MYNNNSINNHLFIRKILVWIDLLNSNLNHRIQMKKKKKKTYFSMRKYKLFMVLKLYIY